MASRPAILVLGIALLVAGTGHAQEPAARQDDEFWLVRQRQEAAAAAQLLLARNPLIVAVLRAEGLRWKVWQEPEFLADTAPNLSQEWLDGVRDGTPMPNLLGKIIEGDFKDEIRKDQYAVYKVWSQAVVIAFNTPPDAFAKSAAESSHVTFAHLWTNPGNYRGKVIPIKGRLGRVRRYEATSDAQKEGVKWVYEGWILGPTKHSHPFCVVFTHLPDGLKEAEEMSVPVSFNGYFIKKMKYPTPKGFQETPMFIGPTITVHKEAPADPAATPISAKMIAAVFGVVIAVGVSLCLLSWYFRRGDLAVKERLNQLQAARAMASFENGDEPPPAGEPVALAKPVDPQGITHEPPGRNGSPS